MRERMYLIIDKGTSAGGKLERGKNVSYTSFHGAAYTEDALRAWAIGALGTSEEATLEDIARDLRNKGWLLYEDVGPSVPETEKSLMQKVADGFQSDLELYATSIAEAFRTGLCVLVEAKTAVTEVYNNKAVITTILVLTSRQPAAGTKKVSENAQAIKRSVLRRLTEWDVLS